MERLLKASQVAEKYQLPLARVYELVRLEVLPYVRFGERQLRFDEEVLNAWIKNGGLQKASETESTNSDGASGITGNP